MEEEINTLVSAGTLYKNNKNLLLSELYSKKDHKPNELSDFFTDAESNGNESQTTVDLEISEFSTPTENDQSDNPKDSL